ncbi:MAG: PIN domain-containing protein [Candidatus Hydrogenedentota bacterium]
MILADTSVWIEYLRSKDADFAVMVSERRIAMHELVIGELACGTLPERGRSLDNFRELPRLSTTQDREVGFFIEQYRLWGRGLGIVDVHLLVSAALSGARLWTHDVRLHHAAEELEIAFAR